MLVMTPSGHRAGNTARRAWLYLAGNHRV